MNKNFDQRCFNCFVQQALRQITGKDFRKQSDDVKSQRAKLPSIAVSLQRKPESGIGVAYASNLRGIGRKLEAYATLDFRRLSMELSDD